MRRSFRRDQRGIVLAGIIAICFIFLSSFLWLIAALITNRVFDALLPFYNASSSIRPGLVGANMVNMVGVFIVVVDLLLVVWWAFSAQNVESQEYAGSIS